MEARRLKKEARETKMESRIRTIIWIQMIVRICAPKLAMHDASEAQTGAPGAQKGDPGDQSGAPNSHYHLDPDDSANLVLHVGFPGLLFEPPGSILSLHT